MFFVKKIVVTGILGIALYPAFLYAMDSSLEIQLNFQKALDAQDFEKAEMLLKQGANPNAIFRNASAVGRKTLDHYSQPVLGHYAQFGTAEQVTFLLENGANAFLFNEVGEHALLFCLHNTEENALKIIPLLVEKVGVDYPRQGIFKELGYTALQSAVEISCDRISVIKLLLELGANSNCPELLGCPKSPLNTFSEDISYFSIRTLLYLYGGDPERINPDLYAEVLTSLIPEQIAELQQARERYVRDKALYNQELSAYLPLPMPLVEICFDYSAKTVAAKCCCSEIII